MNKEVPLTLGKMRLLTQTDLESERPTKGSKAPALKRITARHHMIARCLAEGMTVSETAAYVDLHPTRVSILKDDESVKALIAFYAKAVEERYYGMHERMAEAGETATEILIERMEEDPDKFSNDELLKLISTTADRTGHGVQTKSDVNVNVGLASRLDAARRRMREINPDTEDAEVIECSPTTKK